MRMTLMARTRSCGKASRPYSCRISERAHQAARKLKRAKLRAKAAKAQSGSKAIAQKAKTSFSDYARPAVASGSGSTYRPAQSVVKEDDFMANLLSSVTATTAEPTRKRRSSPEFPSSDAAEPSSDSSFFGIKKRYGQESDDEDHYRRRSTLGKKPRVSDMTIVPNENEPDYGGMDLDEPMVKDEPLSDEEMEIKPRNAPLTSAATKLNGQSVRRKVVNSTSVKHVVKSDSIVAKVEPDTSPVKPKIAMDKKPIPNGTAHWSSVQETLAGQAKAGELDAVKAPVGSVKVEKVIEQDGTLRMFWLDQMEQDGVVHLVGKVLDRQSGKYVSACLSVNGIKRNLFVKPRPKRYRKSILPVPSPLPLLPADMA